jgi:hypothetical protein
MEWNLRWMQPWLYEGVRGTWIASARRFDQSTRPFLLPPVRCYLVSCTKAAAG